MPTNKCITVYKFDELSDDAKEKARGWFRDGALDYEWWDDEYMLEGWKEKYGIAFDMKKMYFDLDGSHYLYWGKGGIWIENQNKLAKAIYGKGYQLLANSGLISSYFDTHHYGGGSGRTELCVEDFRSSESKDLPADCDEWFKDLVEEYWHFLYKEMEYLLSDESIDETIRINEYEFTEEGKRSVVI